MSFLNPLVLWRYPALQWWQGSRIGQLSGRLQKWGDVSWVVRGLLPASVGIAVLYIAMSSQAATGPLGLILLLMAALTGIQWIFLPPVPSPLHLPLGVYWGIATIATALSPVGTFAIEGWMKLTLYLLGFLLLHRVMLNPRYRNWLVAALLLTGLWISIYGMRQAFFGAEELATWTDPNSPLADATRVYSYLRNPNLLAGYLVPIVPIGAIAAWVWTGWGSKLFAVTATGLNALCLVNTLSRGGWLGLLGAVVVLGLLMVQWYQFILPARLQKWALPAVLGMGALAIAMAVLFVEPVRIRVLSIFAGREDSSNNFRINVWMAVMDMIRDFPVLGIGPGNDAFNRVYPLYQQPNYSALGAYSVPLELTLETGLTGAIAYLWFVVVTALHGLRRWLQLLGPRAPQALWIAAGLSACAGMMVHGLVDTVWYRPQVQMLWWFSIALISSQLVEQPTPVSPAKADEGE